MRGEYDLDLLADDRILELPPRARRILKDCDDFGVRHGTTSACAENTTIIQNAKTNLGNYLRVRGEYIVTE